MEDDSASEASEPAKKRQRANSNVSAKSDASSSKGKKTAKASMKAAAKNEGNMTRRKSSGEWKPNPEMNIPKVEVKEFKFQRIDESKFTNLHGAAKDNSYEAKKLFGQTGDTYGDWSNQRLKDKVGKGFTKEKNKMKNKNFHASGGRFNTSAVNSVLM